MVTKLCHLSPFYSYVFNCLTLSKPAGTDHLYFYTKVNQLQKKQQYQYDQSISCNWNFKGKLSKNTEFCQKILNSWNKCSTSFLRHLE